MEEMCGPQGRLCWKINHIWSNSTVALYSQPMNFSAHPCGSESRDLATSAEDDVKTCCRIFTWIGSSQFHLCFLSRTLRSWIARTNTLVSWYGRTHIINSSMLYSWMWNLDQEKTEETYYMYLTQWQSKEHLNEWMNEWMNEWTNERFNYQIQFQLLQS